MIWTDETSIVLNSRRGRIRQWRQPGEIYVKSAVRRRFLGAMEFMFWGCFSYDQKGPCYIWKSETVAEKKECVEHLTKINKPWSPRPNCNGNSRPVYDVWAYAIFLAEVHSRNWKSHHYREERGNQLVPLSS